MTAKPPKIKAQLSSPSIQQRGTTSNTELPVLVSVQRSRSTVGERARSVSEYYRPMTTYTRKKSKWKQRSVCYSESDIEEKKGISNCLDLPALKGEWWAMNCIQGNT